MRQVKRHRRKAEDPDLTPALDVVFILLIFFIVTATFVEEQTLRMEPPPPPGPSPEAPAIVVRLDADGLVGVNDKLTDIAFVRANIERLRAETPDSNLVIQAHPAAKSGAVLRVRDAAYSAGYGEGVGVLLSEETG